MSDGMGNQMDTGSLHDPVNSSDISPKESSAVATKAQHENDLSPPQTSPNVEGAGVAEKPLAQQVPVPKPRGGARPQVSSQSVEKVEVGAEAGAGEQVADHGAPRDDYRSDMKRLFEEMKVMKEEMDVLKRKAQDHDNLVKEVVRLKTQLQNLSAREPAGASSSGITEGQAKRCLEDLNDEISKTYMKTFKVCCEKTVQDTLCPLRQSFDTCVESMQTTESIIKGFEKDLKQHQQLMWDLRKGLDHVSSSLASETCGRLWIIEGFNHFANQGVIIVSKEFGSPRGYRFKAYAYPNGVGDASGTHMSLAWCLAPTEFDDYQEWPFQGTVRFKLMPRPGSSLEPLVSESPQLDETPDYNALPFQKPDPRAVPDEDRFEGIEKFITHEALMADYIWPDKDGGKVVIDVSVWPSFNWR